MILVVMRGICPFVQKAHFAQLAGAKMLLVVDNKDEDVQSHIMVDGGYGGKHMRL